MGVLSGIALVIEYMVLQPITLIIETVVSIVYYFLYGSWLVGFCLVEGGTYIWRFLCDIFEVLGIFVSEVSRFCCELREIFFEVSEYVQGGTCDGILLVEKTFKATAQHLHNFVRTTEVHTRLWATAAGGTLSTIGRFLFNVLVGIGNCVLWLLMLVPRAVAAFLDYLLYVLETGVRFLITRGVELLSSVFRLSIGLAVLLLLYMFRGYLYLFIAYALRQMCVKCMSKIRSAYFWIDENIFGWLQKLEIQRGKALDTSTREGCVVCMDRSRCIVILPCRHFCMCKECSEQLIHIPNYDQQVCRCPVCRHNIEGMMSVYV